MRRGVLIVAVVAAACDSSGSGAQRDEGREEASASADAAPSGPRLAKHDPDIHPYVAEPVVPLDFSGVDVGDAPMKDAAASLDALGRALVEGLDERDRSALERLALTRSEYEDRFFEVLIHHRNALKMGAALAWSELSGESKGDLSTALQRHGGRGYTFVRIDVKQVDERPKVKLHRSPRIVVRDAEGEESSLVMVGSIVEHTPSGGFKVLAFRDTP